MILTLFLFFIDEGYYDFRWMKDLGNWFVFVIYVVGIYAVLLAVTLLVALFVKMAQQLAD